MKNRRRGVWVVVLCVLASLLLTVIPLPPLVEWLRPAFALLVVIYWSIALPNHHGTWFGFWTGMLMDTLRATPFGTHALAFAVAGYAANQLTARMKVYPMLQQMIAVGLLVGVATVLMRMLGNLTDSNTASLAVAMLPVLSSALLWPWAMAVQDRLRRVFAVN